MINKNIKRKLITMITIVITIMLLMLSVMFGMFYYKHSKYLESKLAKEILNTKKLEDKIEFLDKSKRMYFLQLKEFQNLLQIKGNENVK